METTKTLNVKAELIDPSIENANPENCNMSILFQRDGLVFSILRNDIGKFIVLGEYETDALSPDTQALFSFQDQLQGPFSAVQLGFYTPKYTLIPATLFNSADAKSIADFQFALASDEVLRYDELNTHDMVLLYALPKSIATLADEIFGKHVLHHAAYYTITHFLDQYKNKPGEHIHAQLWRQHVEVTVVKNGKLITSNSFNFQTDEDLLYFILNIYEQLELNPESVPLKLAGEILKGTSRWQMLEKYIRFVEVEKRPDVQYSHEFRAVPEHKYNRVFQAALCA